VERVTPVKSRNRKEKTGGEDQERWKIMPCLGKIQIGLGSNRHEGVAGPGRKKKMRQPDEPEKRKGGKRCLGKRKIQELRPKGIPSTRKRITQEKKYGRRDFRSTTPSPQTFYSSNWEGKWEGGNEKLHKTSPWREECYRPHRIRRWVKSFRLNEVIGAQVAMGGGDERERGKEERGGEKETSE